MKSILSLLLLSVCLMACDTSKKNNTLAEQPSNSTYVSPPVLVERATLPPLPADSIPVEYSVKGIAQAPTAFVPMMGQWVSAYDDDESVHFVPGKYISYYKGEKVIEENMVYYRVCPDSCTGNDNPRPQACFVLASPYGQTCFAIVSHTNQRLELSLLGSGDDSVITYLRK